MPRPKLRRKMDNPPHFKGFKPIGTSEEGSPIVMNYDEYESIRLSDFEFMGQMGASHEMGVSRPTFTRIYESARRKIAQAFILGKVIVFEGGKVYFDSEWYMCNNCGCFFNHLRKECDVNKCALCGSSEIQRYMNNDQISASDCRNNNHHFGNNKIN